MKNIASARPAVGYRFRLGVLFVLGLGLAGCASTEGYQQRYQPTSGLTAEKVARLRAGPPPAEPAVRHAGSEGENDVVRDFVMRGYMFIGSASFDSTAEQSEDGAVAQAQAVGADIVLIFRPSLVNSERRIVPLTLPTTTVSTTTGSATAYGRGGPVTVYGSATTRTYGTETTYVPIIRDHRAHLAVYFVKRHYDLGVLTQNVPDSGANASLDREVAAAPTAMPQTPGVLVTGVVENTPAFKAEIQAGDILTAVNGTPIASKARLTEIVGGLKGQQIAIDLLRDGQPIRKSVQLDAKD